METLDDDGMDDEGGWEAARGFGDPTAEEFFAQELPERKWVVEGLLPEGSATLLTAREKAGKGLLSLDLCCSIARGEPFLGRTTRSGTAMYCAAEEDPSLLRDRLAARLGGPAGVAGLPLRIVSLDGSTEDRLRLEEPAEFARLLATVRARRPSVLVLDTLRELHHRLEDRSDEMGPLLRPLRQLAHRFGVALVVTHHQNKGQEFRGSTAIRAAFDQEWAFHRADRGDEAIRGVLSVEGRFGGPQKLRIGLGEGLRWELAGEGEANGRGGRGPALRDRIPFFLADRPAGATAQEIATSLGVSARAVALAVEAALAEPDAGIVATGSGKAHDARRYRLANRVADTTLSEDQAATLTARWDATGG